MGIRNDLANERIRNGGSCNKEKRTQRHYESEEEDDLEEENRIANDLEDGTEEDVVNSNGKRSANLLPAVVPLKQHKLDVPWQTTQKERKEDKLKVLTKALDDIAKVIRSPKTNFASARAIQSNLQMQKAALSQGFAANNSEWVQNCRLPGSRKGCHAKVYSLLDDPTIKAELRVYIRSHKWAMYPKKLAQFTKGELIPKEANKYLQKIVQDEMPKGLKKYMEVELLPRIQMKVGRGISLTNNAQVKNWVFRDQHMLRKKGVGCGIHKSDALCSTVRWLRNGSQSMECGKNYEGYWTGELFVKQLKEKIIPAFEEVHGTGYQALIMVGNSQGHSAYAEDALLITHMNIDPGGKQAHQQHGWYLDASGIIISQSMIFPASHPEHPDQPKGIKQKYLHEHCDYSFSTLQENMPKALESIAIETIRRWEHCMYRWMDAYQEGKDTQSTQLHVQQFSSCKYTSHRHILEAVASAFDQ
ncbi:hypothetical protein BT96DRAFT_958677 [Gymnopus androsaceus JB14]|uniref:DDE-1 domain-containing protein n=1 Tax=Gymnopus androsaceus JB14 TaxID=1447944 RepID=A0A6A4HBF2_9AGAR|nr:hypothetical protein BT96DRAFT_958677 [Gymnopus androsaceus JB14]